MNEAEAAYSKTTTTAELGGIPRRGPTVDSLALTATLTASMVAKIIVSFSGSPADFLPPTH